METKRNLLTTEAAKYLGFRPKLADAHKKLNDLIEGIGAYTGTMQNLQDLLSSSFPMLILASFFALIIFANVKLFHSEILSEITVVYAGLVAVTLATVSFIFYKWKH